MAEIAAGFIAVALEAVKLVAKPITRQFSYLCCFTRNINNLKDEDEKLDDEIRGLEMDVQTATNNAQVILPEVKTWLRKSNGIKAEITAIVSEAENVGSCCSKLGARFSLSKRANKTTHRSTEHRGQKSFDSISQAGPPAAAQTFPGGKTLDFESRRQIEEAIMTTLRGEGVNLIGIYGMGGLGKTTMANRIRNRVLKENVFQEVAMTVVSQQAETSKIQVEIGGSLGLHLKDDSSETRVQKLHARLSGTKRILVILDDVWHRIKLEELGIPCDSKGCTILITSRNSDALSGMGCKVENKFGMEILSEEEAWCLFREGTGTCVDDTKLNPIAKQVAQECKGLPIALTTLGVALKEKDDASIWNDALRELKQCDADIPNYIKEVYTPLKWSYNFLDSEKAKSLFLLCCLFPEDSHIPLEELTYFCMGLGIFGGNINLEDARNKTCSLTDFLKSRSLLLESNKEDHVRMHDVVRDVCIYIAKQKGCIGGNNCTWISSSQLVGERNEILTESRFPNLRLLSLSSSEEEEFEFGSAFLEGINDLYVFSVNSYRKLTSLPHTTQSLMNLKTLLLYSCRGLKTISAVGKLRNLEILICWDCFSIEELPVEMKGLNRLKLLELTGCPKLQSIGRGIISSLIALEELKMLESFNGWEAEDREERENASIKELADLTNLACLEIEIHPSLVTKDMNLILSKKIVRFRITTDGRNLLPSNFSKAMSLWLERESRLGDWIEKQLLKDTECMWLRGDGANNVDLAKIQNIRWLELSGCESMKNVDATVFPSIEHLRLESLPELQEICDGPISSTSFQNLKELNLTKLRALTQIWKSSSVCENNNVPHFTNLSSIVIDKCDSLRNLGQLSMAGKDCLPHLQQLGISNCEMMEQVFLWNDNEEAGENKGIIKYQQNRNVITKVFPKLKEVVLVFLPNLTTFYQGIEGIEFPQLKKLEIEECPKMKSIVMASKEKSNSGEITSSIDDDDDDTLHLFCQSQKVSFGSSLEVLGIDHSPLCAHEIPSLFFNGLEELRINKYEGSMSLFTLSMAENLVSLRELRITKCDEMRKVIEDKEQQGRILVFPKLKELYLDGLPKLVSFCDSKCEVEFPLLWKVEIYDCPNMESLSMGLVATPNLETFKTDLSTYDVGVGVNVAFDSLKELEIRSNRNPFVDSKISVSLFNRLEKLEFSFYKGGSMSLFSSSAVGNLVNLRVLGIEDCDEMLVNVIEDEDGKVVSGGVLFPKLEELTLWSLPKLVRFCEWKCDVQLPSLRKVFINSCPNMENFSMGVVDAPNLEFISINWKYIEAAKDLNGALQQCFLAQQEEKRRTKEEEEGGEEEQETKDYHN